MPTRRRTADGIHLEVPVYLTAKGTEVAGRSWRLKQGEGGACAHGAKAERNADTNDATKAISRDAFSRDRNH